MEVAGGGKELKQKGSALYAYCISMWIILCIAL